MNVNQCLFYVLWNRRNYRRKNVLISMRFMMQKSNQIKILSQGFQILKSWHVFFWFLSVSMNKMNLKSCFLVFRNLILMFTWLFFSMIPKEMRMRKWMVTLVCNNKLIYAFLPSYFSFPSNSNNFSRFWLLATSPCSPKVAVLDTTSSSRTD